MRISCASNWCGAGWRAMCGPEQCPGDSGAHSRAPDASRLRRVTASPGEIYELPFESSPWLAHARCSRPQRCTRDRCLCLDAPAPTAQIDAAQVAIAKAEQADAGRFAAGDLSEARAKLASANTAVQAEEMVTAAQFAEESQVAAELASSRATASKARTVNEEMQRSTGTLVEEMQRVEGEKK